MDNIEEGSFIYSVATLEDLDTLNDIITESMEFNKNIVGDKLEYDIDLDYDKCEITLNVKLETNDSITEADTQSN